MDILLGDDRAEPARHVLVLLAFVVHEHVLKMIIYYVFKFLNYDNHSLKVEIQNIQLVHTSGERTSEPGKVFSSNQYLEGRDEVDGDADVGNGESLANQVGSVQQQLVELLQLGEQLFSENQHFSPDPFFSNAASKS